MGTRTMGSHGKELYNLTLDEVQRQLGDLGKPLSSMNINELIKSVWNAESEVDQGGLIGRRGLRLCHRRWRI
ncbi:putative plant bZIP transcription factor [Helianthus annuus]|nr:putative plant bZIP transcription factor [Helianthus annuus]